MVQVTPLHPSGNSSLALKSLTCDTCPPSPLALHPLTPNNFLGVVCIFPQIIFPQTAHSEK